MRRREKIEALKKLQDQEIDAIHSKYKPQFDELQYDFTVQELLNDGWIQSGSLHTIYADHSLVFEKNQRSIRVRILEGKVLDVITYSGCPQRSICDMDDLNYYFINNK